VETRHFDVRSSLGEAASLRLAHELESFAIACEAILGTPLALPAVRTRVYAHDGKGFERPFDVGNRPAYFLSTLDGGVLVLRVGGGFADATPEVRFELARYLAHNNGGLDTPLWYDEGFASFLSTAEVAGRAVVVGQARTDLLALLQDQVWPATDQVLRTSSASDWGRRERDLFRARAWAIVHFAHFGGVIEGDLRAALDAALARPDSRGDAALDWFGVPGADFDVALRAYVGREIGGDRLVVRIPEPPAVETSRRLDCPEVGSALGALALAIERPVLAERYYGFALGCDPSSAVAHAGLARAQASRGDYARASEHRERALTLAPDDVQVQLDTGASLESLARDTKSRLVRAALIGTARRHYQRASELDPDLATPHVRLARTFLARPVEEVSHALEPIARARILLPASMESLLTQARAHADLGELSMARDLTETIVARADEPGLRDDARALADWTDRSPRGPRP